MGAVGRTDACVQRERIAVCAQPTGTWRGVLREKANELSARAFGAEVAGTPVPKFGGCYLQQRGPSRLDDLERAISRARVDHQDLVDLLPTQRVQHLLQVALSV